jgi:Family of unknown function (DUF6599)
MGNADRLLNPRGRKHYRRSYSLTEVKLGALVLVGLGGVAGWVGYMGAHPDPGLFANTPDLLDPGSVPVERGPLPEALAAPGWVEGKLAAFDIDNLYEKINGRAGYFKSKGFVGLLYLPLSRDGVSDDTIDLEVYDMGAPENAHGAYVGEKPDTITSTEADGGVWHKDRNALYLARGRYYVRAIGARESEGVSAALDHLRDGLQAGLAAGAKPWAHALFGGALGFEGSTIRFAKENAMSFDFATGVYSVVEGEDTELFAVATTDPQAAKALAEQFVEGFSSYGEAEEVEGLRWIKDRYLGAYSSVRVAGPLVVGVRGAPDREAAGKRLGELVEAAEGLPAPVIAKAVASADPSKDTERQAQPPGEAAPQPEGATEPSE